MFNQKGQTAVEFALILPFFFTLVFAVFYVGIMFMDYIQYSNAARYTARDIALASSEERVTIADEINDDENSNHTTRIKKYIEPLTSLYTAGFEAALGADEVTVTITLTRNDKDFPSLLYDYNFPPKNLNPIVYKMRLEN